MRWMRVSPKQTRQEDENHEQSTTYLTPFSQKLRREMTAQERHLWYDCLKTLPLRIRRQHVLGPYIVDFYVPEKRLVIELDGSQHFDSEGAEQDHKQDAYFTEHGITVVRYSNHEISASFDAVCEDLYRRLELEID